MQKMHKRLEVFYPTITDEVSAKKAASFGYWAAAFIAGINLVMIFLGAVSQSALFDALVMIVIGFFIYKMSRVAAVAGLLYAIFDLIYKVYMGQSPAIAIKLFFILYFISGVRGTFAYRNYLNSKK